MTEIAFKQSEILGIYQRQRTLSKILEGTEITIYDTSEANKQRDNEVYLK
jgi:hypothetical protein